MRRRQRDQGAFYMLICSPSIHPSIHPSFILFLFICCSAHPSPDSARASSLFDSAANARTNSKYFRLLLYQPWSVGWLSIVRHRIRSLRPSSALCVLTMCSYALSRMPRLLGVMCRCLGSVTMKTSFNKNAYVPGETAQVHTG